MLFPFEENLTIQGLDARDVRLLDLAAGYARVLAAQATGRPVMKAGVFCYTADGSRPATAVYDPKTRSVGVHKYFLENITDHLDAAQKSTLEMMLIQQRPFEHMLTLDNCAGIIAALVHEHAHHQFYTKLKAPICAILRKHGECLHDGFGDLRIRAINEGFAYAVQEQATGFVALSEDMADEYDNSNILAQYYVTLRNAEVPLADALLEMIEREGFPDYRPIALLTSFSRKEENKKRLIAAQERCRQRQARRQAACSS